MRRATANASWFVVGAVGMVLVAVQFVAPLTDALYQETITPTTALPPPPSTLPPPPPTTASAPTTSLFDRPESPEVPREDLIEDYLEAIGEATADALIVYQPERSMVVGEATFVDALVTLDRELDPSDVVPGGVADPIDVGFQTEARLLDAACPDCAFAISDNDWQTQEFPSDSNELSWRWQVTPLRCGAFSLTLQTRPVLRVEGRPLERLPVTETEHVIGVRAYPDQERLESVLDSDRLILVLEPEGEVVTESEVVVRAEIDPPPPASVSLIAELRASASVVAAPSQARAWNGQGPIEWTVTATSPGPQQLSVLATSARAVPTGCPTLEARRDASLAVIEPPPSTGSRLNTAVKWTIGTVGGVLGIAVSTIALRKYRAQKPAAVNPDLSGFANHDDDPEAPTPDDSTGGGAP